MSHRFTTKTIETEEELRTLLGEPTPLVCAKVSHQLNPLTRRCIELSLDIFKRVRKNARNLLRLNLSDRTLLSL